MYHCSWWEKSFNSNMASKSLYLNSSRKLLSHGRAPGNEARVAAHCVRSGMEPPGLNWQRNKMLWGCFSGQIYRKYIFTKSAGNLVEIRPQKRFARGGLPKSGFLAPHGQIVLQGKQSWGCNFFAAEPIFFSSFVKLFIGGVNNT